ncbi:cadherin-related family member 3-like [Sphaerodactylus townsendi]|uniref:cadherin-related family member 3-like n=1 Tax=Sphaerodactylus townsendi TaxID=933632 RepID=UPI0020272276|nr:cadherin-related family member 3-like [Sphaerodactylus townsendi]
MIKLIRQPDYESIRQYQLTIEAIDCDPDNPKSASTMVIIDIKEENDEAPECTPYTYRATVLDNIPPGTNINSFSLSCKDRDSNGSAMRFEIVSGNRGNHFGLDPTRGSSSPKLIVKNPFDFEGEMDFQPQYHLVVHIIDDNLYNKTVSNPRTGTVLIDISVIQTNTQPPTTTPFDKKKGLTIVYTSVNTYSSTDWYIPFIFTLMAIMSIGLTTCWCYLLWRYARCKNPCLKRQVPDPRTIERMNTYRPGTQKEKGEVITEITNCETVFDGEAQDPVTGNLYQYNSKSGARKWKIPQKLMGNDVELTNIYSSSQKLSPENSVSMNSPKEV